MWPGRPDWRTSLFAGLALAALPGLAIAVLMALGAARPLPGSIAIACIAAAAILGADTWLRDIARISAALRAAAEGQNTRRPPLLWPLSRLSREMERMIRTRLSEEEWMHRQLRADEAIVEQLPDPLVVLAADRSVRRVNHAARIAFGADLPAVLRHPTLRAAIDRSIAQGGSPVGGPAPQIAELLIPVPVPRDLHATVINLAAPEDDAARTVLVLADRTRERAVERMRADFVTNASHELRTPLASLIGFIDTLRGPAADDPPAQRRFLDIMAEQSARMNRLIDDLLSLSRIELTEHMPPNERIDLGVRVRRMAAGFEPRLAEREVSLAVEIAEALPEVFADPDQIDQVLQNLLDNALKYGRPAGTIRLVAKIASSGRWPARPGVVLSVADEGAGIAKAHLPRLTERFYRVDQGRSRAAGGTGLGLAIVKHIINRHRGQLVVESELGVGSTFTVWLPLAP